MIIWPISPGPALWEENSFSHLQPAKTVGMSLEKGNGLPHREDVFCAEARRLRHPASGYAWILRKRRETLIEEVGGKMSAD